MPISLHVCAAAWARSPLVVSFLLCDYHPAIGVAKYEALNPPNHARQPTPMLVMLADVFSFHKRNPEPCLAALGYGSQWGCDHGHRPKGKVAPRAVSHLGGF